MFPRSRPEAMLSCGWFYVVVCCVLAQDAAAVVYLRRRRSAVFVVAPKAQRCICAGSAALFLFLFHPHSNANANVQCAISYFVYSMAISKSLGNSTGGQQIIQLQAPFMGSGGPSAVRFQHAHLQFQFNYQTIDR